MNIANEMLDSVRDDPNLLQRVITGDEAVTWRLDGAWALVSRRGLAVGQASSEGEVQGQVNITAADVSDSGAYSCRAFNNVGSVEHERRLNVVGHLFLRSFPNFTALAGEIFRVQCPFGGYPFDSVSWKKGKIPWPVEKDKFGIADNFYVGYKLQGATESYTFKLIPREVRRRHHALLEGLRRAAQYGVIVQAYNGRGAGPPSEDLLVRTLELDGALVHRNMNLSVLNCSLTTVSGWQWPVEKDKFGIADNFYVGYKLQGATESYTFKLIPREVRRRHHALLEGLRRAAQYGVIVQAYNGRGAGPPSEDLLVRTLELDHSISTRTISRRLVANGLHSCRPLRRLPLNPPNRRQRLEWCRARSTWMTEWHRVVFSDESRFCLSSDSRRVRVWRRRGERSNPAAIGTMTAQRYVDDVLQPVTLQGVPNALYQQDNARPHTARISQQALQDVQMLPWPPYSPELSPIEHVWDIIGRRLHALPQPRFEDELWQIVEREWRAIPQDAIRILIDSLPRRVAACIAVRGGPTCY
ncbi:hypothetical protein LAZ67_1006069 [Cordylochernes scorpioides]|uniref:Ig-like domain-containing protein n=1 Tax=Cordylochernes scorpioides TaxID=51811 RepID=A0ABY6K1F5_9ARAC|nr:hypothetical protein LAZ67_1006069 [Cordylochernes scorpioides]